MRIGFANWQVSLAVPADQRRREPVQTTHARDSKDFKRAMLDIENSEQWKVRQDLRES